MSKYSFVIISMDESIHKLFFSNLLQIQYSPCQQVPAIQTMRKSQLSQRSPALSTSAHIMQDHLDRKGQLIEKYRNSTQGDILKIDANARTPRYPPEETPRKTPQRARLRSYRKDITSSQQLSDEAMNDYQKLILGLQYSLETERKRKEALESRNQSLQTEIGNLRNLLVGPEGQKHYQRTAFKDYQDQIASLEQRTVEQKQNYEFIIDSKNEALASLEFQLRALEKRQKEEPREESRKLLQLMGQLDELRASVAKKNILIEKLKYHGAESGSDSDDEAVRAVGKGNRLVHYMEQLQISNKLILRKNIQILNNNKKILKYQEVLDVIEHYLDKKEVKNVDLNVLEHPCVNKLRLLLREKAVFERQLLAQLNEHNKKIAAFQQQVVQRDSVNGGKMLQLVNDNKRLSALTNTLQNNIKNLEKSLEDGRRQEELLNSQIQINKRQFVEEVKKLKEELSTISSVTKNEFDRMKLQNIKLSEQNKSLLFLVGEKEKELIRKGESIKVHEQYKDKINTLNVQVSEKRKIESVSEDGPQIGTKLVLISTFSHWMMEWNKIRNWSNKKVLLNVILDKEEIRTNSLSALPTLVSVLHECFLSSKNVQVQQRAIILLAHYLPHNILKNVNLFVDKVAPVMVRGFRPLIQGEDTEKHRLLNEAALRIVSSMEKNEMRWSAEMTNEMLSVNGLKYLFGLLGGSQVDELVENAYDCLIMIAKQNEMISFMNSFNVATLLLTNLTNEYPCLPHALHLLLALLRSRDFVHSQKSLLEFRKIFAVLKQDDEQIVGLGLDCALALMDNALFVKSLNKIEVISILSQSLRAQSDYHILKKIGQAYAILLAELQTENIPRLLKQVGKLMDVIKTRKFGENRFNRALRIMLKVAQIITDSQQLDEEVLQGVVPLYQHFQAIDGRSRLKLNAIISTLYERNRELVNKFSNEDWILSLVQAYKQTTNNEEMVFLLRLLQFQHDQKRTTEILRSGREGLISKLINDALLPDYNVALPALKNLLAISKQKYAEKFVNKGQFAKLLNKALPSRNEEEYIGAVVSILYYFCKSEDSALIIIELDLVEKIFKVIAERHEKENLIYKCLTLLELCHTTHYKRKILNYLLSNDNNLQLLKTVNFVLKKAKNKQEMGARAVFLYDFLNGKTAVESMALLVEQNPWMVQDLIDLRNQYVSKVDPLVYKIELLLHNMSTINQKVRKIYQKFKIEGDYDSQDDR